jgi:hypothetical protein
MVDEPEAPSEFKGTLLTLELLGSPAGTPASGGEGRPRLFDRPDLVPNKVIGGAVLAVPGASNSVINGKLDGEKGGELLEEDDEDDIVR